MPYYPDLTPYEYLPDSRPDDADLLNIGWLDPAHPFPTRDEDLDPDFFANLVTLAADHYVAATRGVQRCRLPHLFEDDFQFNAVYGTRVLFLGNAEIRVVAADGRRLAAPTLVVHYVRDHAYQPPDVFIEAVTALRVAPTPPLTPGPPSQHDAGGALPPPAI